MSKYNLKFHEALKRAVEDGVKIESDTGEIYSVNEYALCSKNLIGISYPSIRSLMEHEWRAIEKPKRVEFECRWGERHLAGPFPYAHSEDLHQFIGKRTRVIIEEIE